jgi:hypothetical protein
VNQQRAAARLGRLQHLRAVAGERELCGVAAAAFDIAVGHERVGALRHHVVDLGARFAEHGILTREIGLEREGGCDFRCARLEPRAQLVPWLEFGNGTQRVERAENRQQQDHHHDRDHEANRPAACSPENFLHY